MPRVIVVGSGIAGLYTALCARRRGVGDAALVAKAALEDGATRYAQGGIAAAVGPNDSPHLHEPDTLAADAGLGDREPAGVLASEAADRIADLVCPGVAFDREDARLALAPCASIADAVDSRETANLALVARAMTEAALRREESCGAHHRLDFPYSRPESCRHQRFALDAHRPRGLVETAGAAFDEVRS